MTRRIWALLAGIVLLVTVLIVFGLLNRTTHPEPTSTVPQRMTLDPAVVLNVTNFPNATPLNADDSAPYEALRLMVNACPDYSDARRAQVIQHIDWLINPSTIPPDVVAVALGTNPRGRLIFGMASYTQNQWRLNGQNPDSCLLAIGRRLNEMLVAAGETSFSVFDATPAP